MTPYTLFCISHRPALVEDLRRSVAPVPVTHFDGTNPPSFSWMVNQCVRQSPTEYVLIASDKARPTRGHVGKLVALLDQGYAVAALHRFAFFGFPKETFRRIGPFDEGCKPGGYEDSDYLCRLKEANLAYYESEEVPILPLPSSWSNVEAERYFRQKWYSHRGEPVRRLRPETAPYYYLGAPTHQEFLTWVGHTVLLPDSWWFQSIPLISIEGEPHA